MNNLRKIREQKKQTQLSLSIAIGVQQETISAYEKGKSMPTVSTLLKLCEHFNCSADYLLDLTNTKTPVDDLLIANLSPFEAEVVSLVRSLSEIKKNKLIGFIEGLSL